MTKAVLDARGLRCPLPVLKAQKQMRQLSPGDTLEILATDPAADLDFQDYCRATGNELIAASKTEDVFRFVIRRVGDKAGAGPGTA